MRTSEDWIKFAKTPYGGALLALTAVQFIILWVATFFTHGNFSPVVQSDLSDELAVQMMKCKGSPGTVPFGNDFQEIDPPPLFEGADLTGCDQMAKDWAKEIAHPVEASLFVLGFPTPAGGQTFVVLVLYATWILMAHFLIAELFTGKFVAKMGQKPLVLVHGFFALLLFICAAIESAYSAYCSTGLHDYCTFFTTHVKSTALMMAETTCPLMASRIYTTMAFLWMFTAAHIGLGYYVHKHADFEDTMVEIDFGAYVKTSFSKIDFHFCVFLETKVYGKLYLLSLVVQFVMVWVASYFSSATILPYSWKMSGFVIGFPQWYTGQTYASLACFVTFWALLEIAFVEVVTGEVFAKLGQKMMSYIHAVLAVILGCVLFAEIRYIVLVSRYPACAVISPIAGRSIGCMVMTLVMVPIQVGLFFFSKELSEDQSRVSPEDPAVPKAIELEEKPSEAPKKRTPMEVRFAPSTGSVEEREEVREGASVQKKEDAVEDGVEQKSTKHLYDEVPAGKVEAPISDVDLDSDNVASEDRAESHEKAEGEKKKKVEEVVSQSDVHYDSVPTCPENEKVNDV
ncbi:hypothetical protein QR680_017104 [Steinernema hermaphroditum]|uniref:Uncharacterized protein n=1 Tax=Steinernema hermaphroditum TaxID=289476 RepID=A0AA39HDB2_9BILA|nr:hypothetical protein QR680_017104 [Steinernema hermaphroditum]